MMGTFLDTTNFKGGLCVWSFTSPNLKHERQLEPKE